MKNRPIPILIFATIQILMPVFSLVFNAWVIGLPVVTYTKLFVGAKTAFELTEFFAFFPVAGLCIMAMKPWSYPVFIAVTGWTLFSNYSIWTVDYSQSLGILFAANTFGLVCLVYYSHPSVRRVFFDGSVRWWETSPRYLANTTAVINGDIRKECELVNVSCGGALVKTDWEPNSGERINLNFSLKDKTIDVDAEVVHVSEGLFGVKFESAKRGTASKQNMALNNLSEVLKTKQIPLYSKPEPLTEQFQAWMTDLRQGRGLIPNL